MIRIADTENIKLMMMMIIMMLLLSLITLNLLYGTDTYYEDLIVFEFVRSIGNDIANI